MRQNLHFAGKNKRLSDRSCDHDLWPSINLGLSSGVGISKNGFGDHCVQSKALLKQHSEKTKCPKLKLKLLPGVLEKYWHFINNKIKAFC